LNTFLGLTEKELEIMKVFWALEKPVTIQEFLAEYDSKAIRTTLHLNLNRLMEKGLIEATGKTIVTRTPARFYFRKISIEEYMADKILSIYSLNSNFDILKLLTTLYSNDALNLSIDDVENFLKENSN